MLKTLRSIKSLTQPGKDGVRVGNNSRDGYDGIELDRSEIDDGENRDNEDGKKVQKISKSKNLFKSKKSSKSKDTVRSLDFFTPRAKLAFTELKQAFLKAFIFYHRKPKCHIRIETDVLDYAISRVLSQSTLED